MENFREDFNPKSERAEFDLLQLQDKVNIIVEDAINYPLGDDGELTIHIKDNDVLNKYAHLLSDIMYDSKLAKAELMSKVYELIGLFKDYKISLYVITNKIILALNVRKKKIGYKDDIIFDIKCIISNLLNIQSPAIINGDAINIQAATVNNALPSNPIAIINNINNGDYSEEAKLVSQLKDKVIFLPEMNKVPLSTAKKLLDMFNNQYVIGMANNYGIVASPEGKLYKQLNKDDYDLNKEYTYAFGASCMYPNKYIVLLVNTDNMKFKMEHVDQ